MRGLLSHSERRADLGPRRPLGASCLDEAVEQLVAETAQLVRRGGRGAQATEHAGRWVGLDRCGQLLECQASLDTVKVLLTDLSVKASLTRPADAWTRPGPGTSPTMGYDRFQRNAALLLATTERSAVGAGAAPPAKAGASGPSVSSGLRARIQAPHRLRTFLTTRWIASVTSLG